MPNYEYDVPAFAIREYFKRFDLPLRMSLDNMPEPAVMRKVKYRANQLEERWNNLFKNLTIAQILARSGQIVVDRANHIKVVDSDYVLAARETLLGLMDQVRIDNISAEGLMNEINPILAPRFELIAEGNSVTYPAFKITTANESRRRGADSVMEQNFGAGYKVAARRPSGNVTVVNLNEARAILATARSIASQDTALYRAILRQGMITSYSKPIPRHDTSENLENYLAKRRSFFKWDVIKDDSIETLPIADHGTLSSRTWGIEVESGGARGIAAPKGGWDRKGDGSLYSAYNDVDDDYDSYDDEDGGGDCGEFVSPILHSFHSKGLEELLEKLATQPQNDSAGVHVHVGAKDLTARQIGGLVFAYEMIEPLIETSYQRQNREYCKQRRVDEVMAILKTAKTSPYKTYNEWTNSPDYNSVRDSGSSYGTGYDQYIPAGDRYVSLNLHSLDSHGTVEFRAMGPVYEYEHLIKWAHFCREMVNLAAKNVPSREWSNVKSFADVRTIFAKYGTETPAILFDEMLDTRLIESYVSSSDLVEV